VVLSALRNRLVASHPPEVVLAVSRAIAREHERVAWMQGRVRVVRNPVEAPSEERSTPARDGVTFGYLGQLIRPKGVTTLVEAFRHAAIPGARLLVAGDGPLRPQLESEVPPSVDLLGWLDEARKGAFLREIDCLVVPSEWKDPAPLVVNEADAARVPVIGARIGGIPELVPEGSSELLFEPGSADGLAARLSEFAKCPARYQPTEPHGSTWQRHLELVERAYRDARSRLARPGSP
jgi:glycosyltransferase involved in cell wall biosynthesis